MILRFHLGQRGQTLLEVLAALGVGVVVLTAITSVVLSSLSNAQFSKNQNLATQYGQQGMEIVRSIRNNSWSGFYGKSGMIGQTLTYCIPANGVINSNTGSCSSTERIDSFFVREVSFVRMNDPADCVNDCKIRITIIVSFTDSKGTHQSELITYFTKWQ